MCHMNMHDFSKVPYIQLNIYFNVHTQRLVYFLGTFQSLYRLQRLFMGIFTVVNQFFRLFRQEEPQEFTNML